MDYFSKFLKPSPPLETKDVSNHPQEFHKSWIYIKNTLLQPDERQLTRGIKSTEVPKHLKSIVDSLVWESTRTEAGGTGACMEYLLKHDVLGNLVRLSEMDRPPGIQAEVLCTIQNMVVLLDDQFLVHSAVHRAVLRLLRTCVGDDLQEQLDGRNKVMGAASNTIRSQPSEYEADVVNLLCILCSRIRTYPELLMIFFHDKHWFHSEPLFSVEEEDDEDDEDDRPDDEDDRSDDEAGEDKTDRSTIETTGDGRASPANSQTTLKSVPTPAVTKRTEYEFLLFNYLLRFVHREGQIGDFARAGLLFLMDVAIFPDTPSNPTSGDIAASSTKSPTDPISDAALALAEYILDGDFSEVLGAGLGAVYSLLPSKLEFRSPPSIQDTTGSGMMIGATGPEIQNTDGNISATAEDIHSLGMEDASSPDFKLRLDHFLKLLEFLQDVLKQNITQGSPDNSILVGTAIVQPILEAVRQIFLENVLYPSVLECSDIDGSAVAVMSYIEIMLRTIKEGPLAELLVEFLMSEDNDDVRLNQRTHPILTLGSVAGVPPVTANTQKKTRRRKSSAMVLLEMEAPESRKASEYFTSMGRFTLKDLLLSNLRSKSPSTATTALQLLQCMLQQHPQLSVDQLLRVSYDLGLSGDFADTRTMHQNHDNDQIESMANVQSEWDSNISSLDQPETTLSTHEREIDLYLALISRMDPSHNDDAFSTGYDYYLGDALQSIQSQPNFEFDNATKTPSSTGRHKLDPNDPILSTILESLRNFFSNTPKMNIALTGVLAALAIHPTRSLAGWLTFASTGPPHSTDGRKYHEIIVDDGDDRSVDFSIDQKLSSEANVLPASAMDEQSSPVVHGIFHGLVSQLEHHRQITDDFDKYLLERRQGLLFSEHLTDALSLSLDVIEEKLPITSPIDTSRRSKPKSKTSTPSFVSFLTPKKKKASARPATPPKPAGPRQDTPASPFGVHYQHTGSVIVEPFVAPAPRSSPWKNYQVTSWDSAEEDVFSAGWGKPRLPLDKANEASKESQPKPPRITLSQLLDNVVILEESIKELAAIVHVRRSLGIDSIRYI